MVRTAIGPHGAADAPGEAGPAPELAATLWPRRRSTALVLSLLIIAQAVVFLTVTHDAFFATDDFHHFDLAQERSFLHYLATPILGVYPAPGNRLVTFLLHHVFPLDYTVARVFLVATFAATTVVLGQLVRMFARSDRWWTVALLVPFALSLTFVSPVWWWSNGVPVIPGLLFTGVALHAWWRSYTAPDQRLWLVVMVVAIAAAGAFHVKFLLIPAYLVLIRLLILPRMGLPGGLRQLWHERVRWVAVAAAPAVFLAVFVLGGLAATSVVEGERPYLEFMTLAWFHGLVPVSVTNIGLEASDPPAVTWAVVIGSQVVLLAMVAATWMRSSLALRAWALFVGVFAVNAAVVGAVRLPGFGVEVAYVLRYYPEVVFFLPLVLALGLRQGEERRPGLAWERTTLGQAAMGTYAVAFAVAFVVSAPTIVDASDGAQARAWFDNLRPSVDAATAAEPVLRVVDTDTPEYVMPSWMPDNRISTILSLLDVDAVYNDLSEAVYLVREDGHLTEASFRPITTLVADNVPDDGQASIDEVPRGSDGRCLGEGGLVWRPEAGLTGQRLAVAVRYAEAPGGAAALEVETDDPDRPLRRLRLRPLETEAELVALGTAGLHTLRLVPTGDDPICIRHLEVGSLTAAESDG